MAKKRPLQAADEKKRLTERIRGLFEWQGERDMGDRFLIRLTAFAIAMALVVLGAGVAWADQISADADSDAVAVPHANSVTATQAEGTSASYSLSALIKETGNSGDDVFRAGQSDTVSVAIVRTGAWVDTTDPGNDFAGTFSAYNVSQSGSIRITVPACTAVGTSETMYATLNGTASNERTLSSVELTFIITAGAGTSTCTTADTVAPTAASISIDDGASWTKSPTGAVSLDFSANDNVGVASYKLAESSAGLAAATSIAVSPAEASLSRTDQAFSLTGSEGSGKAVWLEVCDAAGNCATASDTIGWDKTAPTVTCVPASFILNQPSANVTATVEDNTGGSGAAVSPVSGSAVTTAMGSFTVSLTGADNAGNETTRSCSYTVSANHTNFGSPVDAANKAKAGQSIPLKWRMTDYNGDPVTSLASVSLGSKACGSTGDASFDPIESYAASGSSGLQNLGDGYYQYNWKTPTSFANSCKEITLSWSGGSHSQHPIFNFTK